MFDKFKRWKEKEFYTTPDTDKSIDWKYVKDTFREYFAGKKNKTELEKLKDKLFHAQYIGSQNSIGLIIFALYLWYPPVTSLIDNIIPTNAIFGINIFMFIGFLAFSYMVSDYIGQISKYRKEIKELEKKNGI